MDVLYLNKISTLIVTFPHFSYILALMFKAKHQKTIKMVWTVVGVLVALSMVVLYIPGLWQ